MSEFAEMPPSDHPEFERLAREYLAGHPEVHHEWRVVRSWVWPDRLDLILTAPSAKSPEVWVSLNPGQITVGAGDSDEDFEDFGRGMTAAQVSEEAFEHLVGLLREHRYVTDRSTGTG